ncbi:MAG: DUF3575 domain-containing protein [Muribaculaceae bacterium]|nr:DUF3575 domain-containing protein [Muribaculaceae bacterium]
MRLIAFALAVITVFTCFGNNNPTDSVKVFFRIGQYQYDPAFGNNRQAMDSFMDILSKAYSEKNVESIEVRAYTSPDGSSKGNQRLSELRCNAIADYISSKLGIRESLIHKIPEGIAWNGLRELVEQTPDVPSKNAVLNILDNTPIWIYDRSGKIIDGRKSRLMSLDKGVPYRWMLANLFPRLRNGVVISIILRETKEEIAQDEGVEDNGNSDIEEKKETLERDENPQYKEEDSESQSPQVSLPAEEISLSSDTVKASRGDSNFALKTNLLGYAVLMPNLEIEWKVARRWSVALEAQGAWWAKNTPHKVYRLSTVIPEARFWPIERSRWHGMYVGVFAGGGLYDLSRGYKGHEGEGGMVGVSVGYMWPISKHLSLDAGIGAGYMRVRDKEYEPLDGHFLYLLTKDINYFGPLRLKLSLVWRIPK